MKKNSLNQNYLNNNKFKIKSKFSPTGDQPKAIEALNENLNNGILYQTLLGVTGSGKTFTIANLIEKQQRPALILAPNKTLAAQLYNEFKDFFPENSVSYFVSYYDYYQPEAYVPSSDTYIEKDSSINEEIDKMRHSATRSILENRDTIVVASVSCIYGLGAPEEYFSKMLFLEVGQEFERELLISKLVDMQYKRTDLDFVRGSFRVRGEVIDIFSADQEQLAIRLLFFGDELETISLIDSITGVEKEKLLRVSIYPTTHFVSSKEAVDKAVKTIQKELIKQVRDLRKEEKTLEADRLEQRTLYDIELLKETGICSGIENYSRHFSGKDQGVPPTTLLDYFPDDFILVVDESHISLSQLKAMYKGDRARKQNLVNYGFRLPSALDNRPLNNEEFWERVGQTVFVSATPGNFELEETKDHIVEQIIRPTSLIDPKIEVKPAINQVDDLIDQIKETIKKGDRVLVITLTKKQAEDLNTYFRELNLNSRYIHSDIKTLERVELLNGLRSGEFDILIGINLLREGLDLVEVSLVAVLDADKEGFLRSARSLIQIIGRAARNINGRVILYADKITNSMNEAISETDRRRAIQVEYNKKHNLKPKSVKRKINEVLTNSISKELTDKLAEFDSKIELPKDPKKLGNYIIKLKKKMFDLAAKQEFEEAAKIRDIIILIDKNNLLCS